ncbi:hypothetical protein KCU64_g27, partial [Aureobasidium melanogenum]
LLTLSTDPVQTSIADGSPSNASAATPALAITKSSRKAVAQTQCPLFLLPTEVRLIIYNYVFGNETIVTGAVSKKTFVRIYTIDQPQHQYDFALLRTCRSIRAEIKEFVNPRSIIRDISAATVVRHLHGSPRSLGHLVHEVELLRKITKLWVRICIQQSDNFDRFRSTTPSVDESLNLTFFDEEEPVGSSPHQNDARSRTSTIPTQALGLQSSSSTIRVDVTVLARSNRFFPSLSIFQQPCFLVCPDADTIPLGPNGFRLN